MTRYTTDRRSTRNPVRTLAFLALCAASTSFERADAFASRAHQGLRPPTTFVGTPEFTEERFTAGLGRRSNVESFRGAGKGATTSLRALPATAALSSSGSFLGAVLATIGNVLLPRSASTLSKIIRVTALLMAGTMFASTKLRHRLFWSGLSYPENLESELLPGSIGCPFIGSPWIVVGGNESYGAGNYYRKASRALGDALGKVPKIWKYYMLGKPFAVVSGGNTFQKVLNMEFDGSLTSSGADLFDGGLLPVQSLLLEGDKKRHSYLRRLVGAALTPTAVAKTASSLQAAAEEQVARMVGESSGEKDDDGGTVKFHQVCTDYTLDVAWRQILGLELTEEEIPVFEQKVDEWIQGIISIRVLLRINVEGHPGYAAREYLIGKINEKIDQLLERGPDNTSTLSGMVFATDEQDPSKKLSRQEIIDNALILIFAGSETSASTLTNAMLFLGLHPEVWNKLAEEQRSIEEVHGDEMTMSTLDVNKAPYLDAVLKETMRMRTVVGGIPRTVLKDIDVDGDGKTIIPKGYLIDPSMLMTHEEDPGTKLPNGMHLDAIQGFRPERWLGSVEESKPEDGWYVPYGFGPRYCLGKNLAQLEMKIFLATLARKLDFPKLSMLPENYDYSPDKKDPSDEDYFSVAWSTSGSVIPVPGDGVLASVSRRAAAGSPNEDDDAPEVSFPVFDATAPAITTATTTTTTTPQMTFNTTEAVNA